MANDEHLEILKQGVDAWNKWRKENPDIRPDLSSTNLTGANLTSSIFVGTHLINYNFKGYNLRNADLSNANLRNADLSNANLSNANLSGAILDGATLVGTNLKGAILDKPIRKELFLEYPTISAIERSAAGNLADILLGIGKPKQSSSDSTSHSFERSLQSQMATMQRNLEEKIEQIKNPLNNNEEIKQHLNDIISEKIDTIISQDIVHKVGEEAVKLSSDFNIKQDISGFIQEKFNDSSKRYGFYGKNSENEALLYRNWGIMFCLAGVGVPLVVLIVILYGQYPNYENWGKIFMGLPLTITLEAIGLLLLTLSQKATERMRSFSVEQCNLDVQSAGYLSLIKSGDMKEITMAMEGLAKSERRYILKKDERTIEESNNKSNLEFMKSVTDTLKPLLNNNNKQP